MYITLKRIILIMILPALLFAQNIAEQKYKLAESYEKQGKYEESLRIYKEIYTEKKSDDKYFAGIIRSLRGMDNYSDMLPYLEERIEDYPAPVIYILYGEVKWRLGDNKTANKFWEKTLEEYQQQDVYTELARVQINLQLYDKAVNTFLQARNDLNNSNIFSDELSKLYIATGNYKDGLEEIIQMLMNQGDMAKSQGRLFAFLTSEEAINYIDDKLGEYADENPDNLYIQELYSWFLRNTDNLDKALEVTIRIDEIRNSGGRNIVFFANNARDDGQYDIALKAYSYIIKQGKNNKNTPSAMYGFTRTLEQKMADNEKMNDDEIDEILESYDKVIEDYPKSQYAAQAYLRLAVLHYKTLNNTSEAIKNIEKLKAEYPSQNIIYEALNMLGEIYLGKNEFDKALEAFKIVSRRSNSNTEKDFAIYNVANIQFYKGNTDSALVMYQKISQDTKSDVSNDALERIMMINENKELIKGLKLYGEYELELLANNTQKAAEKLKQIIKEYPDDNLTMTAHIKLGELYYNNNDYEQAADYLSKLIEKFPDYVNKDYAYFLAGKSYLMLNNPDKAEKTLTKILVEYPRSVYMNEARKIIRKIREQA